MLLQSSTVKDETVIDAYSVPEIRGTAAGSSEELGQSYLGKELLVIMPEHLEQRRNLPAKKRKMKENASRSRVLMKKWRLEDATYNPQT
jgi:hypothetical protein